MHYKNKALILITFLISVLTFTPLVFAVSSDFVFNAVAYYEKNCKKNPERLPRETSFNCYLYEKVAELDQALNSLNARLNQTEVYDATQSAKLEELEQRIAKLENIPSPSPSSSPTTSYIISDNSWKFSAAEINGWLSASFNDSSWITTQAPSGGQCNANSIGLLINEQGALPMSVSRPNWSGASGYFRKTFNLNNIPTSASIRVVLDDDGDLYLNGNLILSDHDDQIAGVQQANIPSSSFLIGTNTIGLRVIDSLGGCQHGQVEITLHN